jgi:hypothetical protein
LLRATLLDIDSAMPASPLAGVELTSPSEMVTTAADGSFELCIVTNQPTEVVEPTDYLDTTIKVVQGGAQGLYPIQLRMFTNARVRSFYTERGLVFDETRAHVLVFQSGDRFSLTLDSAHGAAQVAEQLHAQASQPLVWNAGNDGAFVLFPNVDVTATTAKVVPDFGLPLTVPVRANMLTLAVTFAVLL